MPPVANEKAAAAANGPIVRAPWPDEWDRVVQAWGALPLQGNATRHARVLLVDHPPRLVGWAVLDVSPLDGEAGRLTMFIRPPHRETAGAQRLRTEMETVARRLGVRPHPVTSDSREPSGDLPKGAGAPDYHRPSAS